MTAVERWRRWRAPWPIERTGASRGSGRFAVRAICADSRGDRRPQPPVAPAPPDDARATTATSASTRGSGCATATTPRCSRTSRPRTRTPSAALAHTERLQERALRRDRRPRPGDRRLRAGAPRRPGSTSPAPSRASSTTCTAGAPRARRAARPVRAAGQRAGRDGRARRERARRRRTTTSRSAASRSAPTRPLARVHASTRPAASATTLRFRDLDDAATDLDDVVPDVYYGARVGERRRDVFYIAARRRHAPVPGVAPHARHAGRRRRARVPGGRRPLLRRRRRARAAAASS